LVVEDSWTPDEDDVDSVDLVGDTLVESGGSTVTLGLKGDEECRKFSQIEA
jgi:hypothetical protein